MGTVWYDLHSHTHIHTLCIISAVLHVTSICGFYYHAAFILWLVQYLLFALHTASFETKPVTGPVKTKSVSLSSHAKLELSSLHLYSNYEYTCSGVVHISGCSASSVVIPADNLWEYSYSKESGPKLSLSLLPVLAPCDIHLVLVPSQGDAGIADSGPCSSRSVT